MSVDVIPKKNLVSLGVGEVRVPLQAIYSNAEGVTGVWVFNPKNSRVKFQAVQLGKVLGSEVVVESGLEGGETVVTAGVSQLREAMLVRAL